MAAVDVQMGVVVVVDDLVHTADDLDALLLAYERGEKAPWGTYALMVGSVKLSDTPHMLRVMDILRERFDVNVYDDIDVRVRSLSRLHSEILEIEGHVDMTLKLVDVAKGVLDDDKAIEREQLEATAGTTRRTVIEGELNLRAKLARIPVVKQMMPLLTVLRSKARRVEKQYKTYGDLLAQALYIFLRKCIDVVSFMTAGERTIEWLVSQLVSMLEKDLPEMREIPVTI